MNQYSSNFDLNGATYCPKWIGRIASSASWQDNIEASHTDPKNRKGWGWRYRVRYMGLHSANTDLLPDDQLPMAISVLPTTAGSGLGGFTETPSLSAGTLVTGYFMDGMGGQEPYIDGIIPNSNNEVLKYQPKGDKGGLHLSNDTYKGTNPNRGAFVPDYLKLLKKIERPSYASTQYKVSSSLIKTVSQLLGQ